MGLIFLNSSQVKYTYNKGLFRFILHNSQLSYMFILLVILQIHFPPIPR
jgi:hypothetical protein